MGKLYSRHSSPVFILVEGRPLRPGRETVAPLLELLEQTRAWIGRDARCPDDSQRTHLVGVIEAARQQLSSLVQA